MKIIFLGSSSFNIDTVGKITEEQQWEIHYYPIDAVLEGESDLSEIARSTVILDTQAIGEDLFNVLLSHEETDSDHSILLYDGDDLNLADLFNSNQFQHIRSATSDRTGENKHEQNDTPPSNEELTPRERQILLLICEEFTAKEIGKKLEISERTVDTHRRNIMLKTNTQKTAGLVKYAIKRGLYEL